GSFFDADHPATGVPFPRRSTLLDAGTSINATAKKLRIGVATVHRIKTRMSAHAQAI
ncbi:helix-turn-helix domain-containing protein, partial [Sphingomonas sp. Leaf25]|uniref:helix-turn-helix domain-containing protein n=1 Tax=Sphingomonas sp. Leaf25 TaxID=1735692 RepID=UPI0012E24699